MVRDVSVPDGQIHDVNVSAIGIPQRSGADLNGP